MFWEGIYNGLLGVWTIARIVVPLMIVIEIAKANQWLDRVNRWLHPPFRVIGLSEHAAFPVLVAVIFGLTFGSGVILSNVREGKLSSKELRIIGTFIAICHAMIEDTLLFFVLGVPLWILIFPRLSVAIIASMIVHRFYLWRQEKATMIAN